MQFGATPGSKRTSAILGLDFGTSCTKVVIGLPYLPESPAYAVPLAPEAKVPFFARTTAAVTESTTSEGARGLSARDNPKVRLLVKPTDEDAQAETTVLMARHMRTARCWFLEKHCARYGTFTLDWQANVGVPSAGYKDRTLRNALLRCGRAAWELSKSSETPDRNVAQEALRLADSDTTSIVGAMPEIVAAAIAHTRSTHAKDGMHVIVDVGASTLDICGFILQRAHPDNPFSLLVPLVEHLGTAVLHDRRVKAMLDSGHRVAPSVAWDPRDPHSRVPENATDYVSAESGLREALLRVDALFQENCARALRTVLAGFFAANPRGRWRAGVPIFMTGGGGGMKFYRQPVVDIPKKKHDCAWRHVHIETLAKPRTLIPSELPATVVDRLLVAYGLSFPGYGHLTYKDPNDLPNVPPPPRIRLDERFIGKELT